MTKITYNIEDKGWKKHFPHFKKYIGKAVNETLKQVDIKIDEDIVHLNEMREKAPDMRTMPVIFKDDQLIGGYSNLIDSLHDE